MLFGACVKWCGLMGCGVRVDGRRCPGLDTTQQLVCWLAGHSGVVAERLERPARASSKRASNAKAPHTLPTSPLDPCAGPRGVVRTAPVALRRRVHLTKTSVPLCRRVGEGGPATKHKPILPLHHHLSHHLSLSLLRLPHHHLLASSTSSQSSLHPSVSLQNCATTPSQAACFRTSRAQAFRARRMRLECMYPVGWNCPACFFPRATHRALTRFCPVHQRHLPKLPLACGLGSTRWCRSGASLHTGRPLSYLKQVAMQLAPSHLHDTHTHTHTPHTHTHHTHAHAVRCMGSL